MRWHRWWSSCGSRSGPGSAEYAELCADVRYSCTSGMLLCLSRPLRLAYLLGDLMGMTDVEGAAICDTTPAAYRQRLARARATMRGVIADRCGWSAPPTHAGAASSSPAASTTAPGGCGR